MADASQDSCTEVIQTEQIHERALSHKSKDEAKPSEGRARLFGVSSQNISAWRSNINGSLHKIHRKHLKFEGVRTCNRHRLI